MLKYENNDVSTKRSKYMYIAGNICTLQEIYVHCRLHRVLGGGLGDKGVGWAGRETERGREKGRERGKKRVGGKRGEVTKEQVCSSNQETKK